MPTSGYRHIRKLQLSLDAYILFFPHTILHAAPQERNSNAKKNVIIILALNPFLLVKTNIF